MRILVSGGDGFIGKNLVRSLHSKGHEIIVVDNHITSYLTNDKLEMVRHIDTPIEELRFDEIEKVEVIFHLASVASPLVYKNDFRNVYNPNVKGTEKLIDLARRDSAKLIYSSTSEVYGMLDDEITEGRGISEDSISISHLLTDRSIYPTSKKMGEELVKNFINQNGNAVILRLFNVYGPDMDVRNNGYGRVIPNFINAIRSGKEIQIFGTGKQIRSFIWIDDIIEALELVMDTPGLPAVLNLGNADPISIFDLAQLLFMLENKQVPIRYFDKDPDDPMWRKPNTSKAKEIFHWEPKTTLKEGLTIILKGHSE